MMDIMRVDDHGHLGRNGKSIINPTLQRESEVMRELKQNGILDMFPNAQPHLIVDTKLPTDEDHNYIFIVTILIELSDLILKNSKL